MIRIGLTGNIGSGKTVVASMFKVLHIPVYNADEQAHAITDTAYALKEITKIFGKEILNKEGKPDRKKIAGIVFADKSKLEKLNSIIHPLVLDDFNKWTGRQKNADYVIMESAILFETGYNTFFDKVIFVSAPESVRLQRVMERDHSTTAQVEARMQQQGTESSKMKKSDFVVLNDGKRSLIRQVLKVHNSIIQEKKSC